jgi:large subunit ribosomal protein L6
MSRVGKKPIPIPAGVEVKLKGQALSVKGPKGQIKRTFHSDMIIDINEKEISVRRPTDNRLHRSLHGLTRSLIANMVKGVTDGFQKDLEIRGVGYRAQMQGSKLVLQVGFSHPVEIEPPEGVAFEVTDPTHFRVKGIDKQLVGEIASEIKHIKKPEPYKGSGIRYVGERVRHKVGKAGA